MLSPIEFKQWSLLSEDEVMKRDMDLFKAVSDFRAMDLRDEGAQLIAERFNLVPFWTYFVEFNASGELPYHNTYHATCMFLNVYDGAWHMKLDEDEIRGLLVAAIMHDCNHTGGAKSDAINIRRALIALGLAQRYATSLGLGLTSQEYHVAEWCIRATQYPYTIQPTTIPEMIIRDADLMQLYESDDDLLVQQFIGLYKEYAFGQMLRRETPFTPAEFNVKYYEFISATSWQTSWANTKAQRLGWDAHRARLLNLLNDQL